ncbi:MAG: 3-(methylthio)propionyl-CoA ligase [Rhodospirillales bacterium]
MLQGLMMDRALSIPSIIDYAADLFPDVEIVSATVEGGLHRYGYGAARRRIARLAHALRALGVKPGDRVATLAWNGYRHFELYYAVAGLGAVCHTINPRLFEGQLAYVVNHARDSFLFFDLTFAPLVQKMRPQWPEELRYVAMTDAQHMPREEGLPDLLCYEALLEGQPDDIAWQEMDERAASGLCYTSGTTGEPKGALYSHRSTVLHALSIIATGISCFRAGKRILPVVPLFHVNAWGLPYSAPLSGAGLVFPGPKLDGASLFALLEAEAVHAAWGVPTVWLGLLQEIEKQGRLPKGLEMVLIGGSAAPRSMIEAFERDLGVEVVHGWGMTEMSPVGTTSMLSPRMAGEDLERRIDYKAAQGRRVFNVEMKIVDEAGKHLPQDGIASGELFVRGPFIAAGYFENQAASAACCDAEGWFATGDVAKITPHGLLQLVDRTKDLVKSGGEWISSLDLENIAIAHPAVANCAVIAVPHPKWDERPLLCVVKAVDSELAKEELLDFVAKQVAKWQVPDDVVFLDSLPMTATGKISKMTLRQQLGDYRLPGVEG